MSAYGDARKKLKVKKYEIKVWPAQWQLPSVDIECATVTTLASFILNAHFKVKPCLPWQTCNGQLPQIDNDESLSCGLSQIITFFSDEGFDVDSHLTAEQEADKLAFISLLEQHLKPAILYALWCDHENYNQVTRPAYAKLCGFPRNIWYPASMRHKAEQMILQGATLRENQQMSDYRRSIYAKARACMNVIDGQLGKAKKAKGAYFFGASPSTIDAVIHGYLSVLSAYPLKSAELKNHFFSCTNLKQHVELITKNVKSCVNVQIESSEESAASHTSLIEKDAVVTVGVGVSLMLIYALTCGVFTSDKSLLAKKLGTVTRG